jgi:hypothetical protein
VGLAWLLSRFLTGPDSFKREVMMVVESKESTFVIMVYDEVTCVAGEVSGQDVIESHRVAAVPLSTTRDEENG